LGDKLVCVGFGSGTGTNLDFLLRNARNFEIPAIFSDQISPIKEICHSFDISWLYLDGLEACGSRNLAMQQGKMAEYESRCDRYNQDVFSKIKEFFSKNSMPDFLILAGYMRIVGASLLKEFRDRIINVHPGDLSWRDRDGVRILRGSQAVLRALSCGVAQTFSSVHLVSKAIDSGEILVRSKPCQVDWNSQRGLRAEVMQGFGKPLEPEDLSESELLSHLQDLKTSSPKVFKGLKKLASHHQAKQKKISDWPALLKAVELLAEGGFEVSSQCWEDSTRKIKFYGEIVPVSGLELA
jgi:folate-dependent phosphoribosylglycinamide formyltransferase PurN